MLFMKEVDAEEKKENFRSFGQRRFGIWVLAKSTKEKQFPENVLRQRNKWNGTNARDLQPSLICNHPAWIIAKDNSFCICISTILLFG